MSEENPPNPQRPAGGGGVKMASMPAWHKVVLSLAVLVSAAGAAGWVTTGAAQRTAEVKTAPVEGQPPAGSSRLLSGAPRGAEASDPNVQPEPSLAERISPRMMRIGVSLIVGFVIGFLFRAFVKTMLLVTLVIGGIVFALTYFNIVNIDLTAAQGTYESGKEWLTDQATRLKDVVLAQLPSSASGGLGAFIGFRRR